MLGIVGWLKEKADDIKDKVVDCYDAAKDKIADCYDTVKDKFVDGVDAVKEHSTNMWNGITGKNLMEQAEAVWDRVEKHKIKINKCKTEIEKLGRVIDTKISNINYLKNEIYRNHFMKFKSLADRLHNLNIHGQSFNEFFDESIVTFAYLTSVKDKSDCFKIDFDNLSFSEKFFGFLSLGYMTRKAARESLEEVKKTELSLAHDVAKIKEHLAKVGKTVEAISQIEEYFSFITTNYVKLLGRFEYGVRTQTYKRIIENHVNVSGKINFKEIPVVHIEEFHAIFNLSIVLKKMASLGYLSESGEMLVHDIAEYENLKDMVSKSELIAA